MTPVLKTHLARCAKTAAKIAKRLCSSSFVEVGPIDQFRKCLIYDMAMDIFEGEHGYALTFDTYPEANAAYDYVIGCIEKELNNAA